MNEIICGDCLSIMPNLPANSVDSVICDPPYGLEFMGKEWDAPWKQNGTVLSDPSVVGGFQDGAGGNPYSRSRIRFGRSNMEGFQDFMYKFAVQALRVAKPGAILMAFGGTRTFHRLACAIEDAGWEMRDTMCWLYGSGFPKSLDISKQLDKEAGAEREVVGKNPNQRPDANSDLYSINGGKSFDITAPATDSAKLWQGWGTALKPAWEPIIVAMKSLEGTYAENAQKWGVAGLNIDGGRIGTAADMNPNDFDDTKRTAPKFSGTFNGGKTGQYRERIGQVPSGRWPANLLLDEEAARLLDEQSGESKRVDARTECESGNTAIWGAHNKVDSRRPIDSGGGASRFFYTAKASSSERNAGLEDMESQPLENHSDTFSVRMENGVATNPRTDSPRANVHPTVKPVSLMRYLCKLTRTPTGGVVLDPFMGSGTTGIACVLEHRDFIGIEIDENYAEIAKKRIADMEGPLFQEAA